jgi:hypothetical protein
MKVVATAPIPGSSTASFPSAGAMLVRLNSLIGNVLLRDCAHLKMLWRRGAL